MRGIYLPNRIEMNEAFGPSSPDYDGEGWSNGKWRTGASPVTGRSDFIDTYGIAVGYPKPIGPSDSDALENVFHEHQTYRAGAITPGKGTAVKAHMLQWHRGCATQHPE